MKAITSTPLIISAMTCTDPFGKKRTGLKIKATLSGRILELHPQTNTEQMLMVG
jgi:hypothetical protein